MDVERLRRAIAELDEDERAELAAFVVSHLLTTAAALQTFVEELDADTYEAVATELDNAMAEGRR